MKEILKIAEGYNYIGDFRKDHGGLYSQLAKRGELEYLRTHLDNKNSGFNPNKPAILYYLSVNNGSAYKIGITNRTVAERYNNSDLENIEVLKVVKYASGYAARAEESRIIEEFGYAKYTGDDLLSSGNTELFDRDVLHTI